MLTKRLARMRDCSRPRYGGRRGSPHIWWGVSVENRTHGLPRIDHLRRRPGAVRFLSVEPLLEDLGDVDLDGHPLGDRRRRERAAGPADGGGVGRSSSATSARRAGVPFFFKQWGGVPAEEWWTTA